MNNFELRKVFFFHLFNGKNFKASVKHVRGEITLPGITLQLLDHSDEHASEE